MDFVDEKNLYRVSPQTKEFEILSVKRDMPYVIDSNDDVRLIVRVRRNQTSLTKFQFSAFIDNVANGGERTGMSFTDEIEWPEGKNEAEFSIRIPECHLAQGKYIMDVWTSTGDILSSYKFYDCVYDTVTFRVATYAGLHIAEWHNYWGENTWKAKAELVK